MLVFGLNIEEFEYAFQLDGPYDEKKDCGFIKTISCLIHTPGQ